MLLSSVSGIRALQWLKELSSYLRSKSVRPPLPEQVGKFTGDPLWKPVFNYDSTIARNWRSFTTILEHQEAYAFARDYQYARRSRRYLYALGQQSKLRAHYEAWAVFMRQNTAANLKAIAAADPDTLALKSFADIRTYQNT